MLESWISFCLLKDALCRGRVGNTWGTGSCAAALSSIELIQQFVVERPRVGSSGTPQAGSRVLIVGKLLIANCLGVSSLSRPMVLLPAHAGAGGFETSMASRSGENLTSTDTRGGQSIYHFILFSFSSQFFMPIGGVLT